METIREKLLYKQNKVHICMRNLSPKEQYECIRLLLATRTNDVFVCTHEATNSYIDLILKKLAIGFYKCSNNLECLE
jgi:hypothetical protein